MNARAELVTAIGELQDLLVLPPVQRASAARRLRGRVGAILSAIGDEATNEVVAEVTYSKAAAMLGVSSSRVGNAVQAHRHRVEGLASS